MPVMMADRIVPENRIKTSWLKVVVSLPVTARAPRRIGFPWKEVTAAAGQSDERPGEVRPRLSASPAFESVVPYAESGAGASNCEAAHARGRRWRDFAMRAKMN
jgi:hypothetical protein